MTVEAANWFTRLAVLSDGAAVPVTNLFDADGEETEDPDEAVTFVAGEGGRWFTGQCADYERVPTH